MMLFCVLTLFPEQINSFVSFGVLGRAVSAGVIRVECVDIREFAVNKHRQVDDYPYGGGAGMVLMPSPVFDAFRRAEAVTGGKGKAVYLTPQGKPYTQKTAAALAEEEALVLLCGHYEGIDERVIDIIKPAEISVGDFILTGGELGALAVIDSVSRLIPGVLGNADSPVFETFSSPMLEYPQYTRPQEFMGHKVPEVLLSGHHGNIEKWRREQSFLRTLERRPDLLT